MARQRHSELVKACCDYGKLQGWAAYAQPTRGFRKTDGSFIPAQDTGRADVLLIKQVTDRPGCYALHRVLWLECKCGKDVLKPKQKAFRDASYERRQEWLEVRDCIDGLKEYLNDTLSHL